MLSEIDVAVSVLDAFFAGNSPDYPPNNAYKTLKTAVLAQQTNNSAMDAIPTLFNKWLLTICQSESDCNVVKSFLRWAQEQHQ